MPKLGTKPKEAASKRAAKQLLKADPLAAAPSAPQRKIKESVYLFDEDVQHLERILALFPSSKRAGRSFKAGMTKAKVLQALASYALRHLPEAQIKEIVYEYFF
jgi:hypothetical protein